MVKCAVRNTMVGFLAVGALVFAGCQSGNSSAGSASRGDSSVTSTRADSDRAILANFVGDWNFGGSWIGEDGTQHAVQGRAAGVLVNNFFVQLDIQVVSGELAGRIGREDGSMLFASEPGVGLTVSAWGDASPAITRLVGRSEAGGRELDFFHAGGAGNAVAMVVKFEGTDRFTAEIRGGAGARSANYTFTRVAAN